MENILLRVNLTSREIKKEEIPKEVIEQYMGGTGLIAYYLYKEMSSHIDPLGPENKIVLVVGPIQGTEVPISGRYSMGAKSPLTGLFLDSNAGGFVGPELAKAGYTAVIIEGKAEYPVYLSIKDEQIEIKDATHLWGKTVSEVEKTVKEEENESAMRFISIGKAGENLVKIACTTSDLFRNAGRGGLGAVYGSKNLKAISIRGTKTLERGNKEEIKKIRADITSRAKKAKSGGHLLHTHGTSWLVNAANGLSQFPTRNFQSGEFEKYEKINHESFMQKYKRIRKPCARCTIACSEYLDASHFPWAKDKYVAKPEYETLGMLGGNCGIDDTDTIIYANHLCNEYGLDTISVGSVIATTMEAVEKGYLQGDEYKDIVFGNKEKFFELIHAIAERKGLGELLAEGVVHITKLWKCEHIAVHSKGLPFAAWDPRGKLGLALSYATAAVGASHLRGWPATTDIPDKSATTIIGSLVEQQDAKTIKDCLTICHFTHSITPPLNFEDCAKITSAVWGREVTTEELSTIAKRIWIVKRMFNIREYKEKKPREFDTVPPRFMKEPLPSGRAKGCTAFVNEEDFEKSMDLLYEERGLDKDGYVLKETLEKLNIKL